jgi:hypothetical protein
MITVKCKPDQPGPDGTSFKDNRSLPIRISRIHSGDTTILLCQRYKH